jgi:hypothetical protein
LSPSGNVITAGVVTISSGNSPINFNGKILSVPNASASLTIDAGTGLVTMSDSVGIAVTTTNAVLPTAYALNDLKVTAANIHILGDVLTRRNQLFTGAVSIGDNGTKGALYEYYLTLLSASDPLAVLPVLANPIYARTFISIDPSITFAGTVDDLVLNTHSLYSAAITHLAPNDAGFASPQITFDSTIGKNTPLYALNLLTMQSTNPAAYIGSIFLKGEVNTFSDQTYRTNALTADPISPLNTVTFTVNDPNAKISFDLFKDVVTNQYSFTNTEGSAGMILNGPATFNGLKTTPILPTGKWNSVTMGMSLGALAASRMGGSSESNKAGSAVDGSNKITPNVATLIPQVSPIGRDQINVGSIMAGIMNNNNFEITKGLLGSSVNVSMGTPAGVGAISDRVSDEVPIEQVKRDEGCQVASADCEEEKK